MKSRWVVVSAMIVAAGLAWAVAGTENPSTAPSIQPTVTDPYLNDSAISTSAPEERKPCSYFNSDCEFAPPGTSCAPVAGYCVCGYAGNCGSIRPR